MEDRFPAFAGLKAFFAVGRASGVAHAAKRLGVSRSAISHQLKNLETELGVRLYERESGTLRLTMEGETFLQAIEGPMNRIRDATEQIRSSPRRQRVSLTVTPSFAASWFLPKMRRLSEQHPEIELNLMATTRVVDLGMENVDIAIRRGMGDWEGLESVPLFKEQVVPIVSPMLLKECGATSLTALVEQSCLLVSSNLPTEWEDWCRVHGVELAADGKRFLLESYELTIGACKDGLGVALGRRPLVDPLLTSGELVQPFEDTQSYNLSYFIVWPKERTPSSMAKKLRNWLIAEATLK